VERLEVEWPSGKKQTFQDVAAGQVLALDEKEAKR